MAAKPEQLVGRWLRSMGIDISSSLLREKLQTHPDYPSLLSITDTLDELGIDNAALEVEQKKWKDIPTPFLTITRDKGGTFWVVKNTSLHLISNTDFLNRWTGLILVADKPNDWKNTENEEHLIKEKRSRQKTLISVLSLTVFAAFCLMNNFSWLVAGLLFSTLAGFVISILIVQHELGISNDFTEQLCITGKHTDCDAVLYSKGGRLGKWVNWADAGIIYFSSYSLLLITLLYNGDTAGISLLAVLSCAALPFTLFSLYYQWRVVKKWCTLCLLTVSILWLQFVLLLPVTLSLSEGELNNISFNIILFTAFVFSAVAVGYLLLIKPALQKNKELTDTNFPLLRFKNNPDVFEVFLKQQRKADTTPFENDLQLGNANAPLQIVVACNPYCSPCASTHKTLHNLAETTDIGLTIRLSVKAEDNEDKRTAAAAYIMQLVKNKGIDFKRKALHDWYELMNLEKFKEKYPLQKEANVQQQLQEHEQWNKEANIEFTPTIFIDGYQLPKQYRVEELKYLLKRKEKIMEPIGETIKENNLALA